jgi:transcription elongation factor GreB
MISSTLTHPSHLLKPSSERTVERAPIQESAEESSQRSTVCERDERMRPPKAASIAAAFRRDPNMRKGFTRRPKAEEPAQHGRNYITPAGLQRLEDERRYLLTRARPATVEVVAWAAGNGDRSENADYQYGTRRLRQIDGRIRFLTKRIEAAEVVDPSAPRSGQRAARAFFGATVRFANAAGAERVVSIVGTDEVDLDRNHISWASPLGRALMKAAEGDEVVHHAPRGTEVLTVLDVSYEHIAVEPFHEPSESDPPAPKPDH